MRGIVVSLILLLSLSMVTGVAAQTGDGSVRGTVEDDQGGALPGVTVTATSPALLSPSVAVTDGRGQYRLINLPPGTYTLTAELAGFSVFQREGILLRAGANFQVDVTMQIGTLEETITVTGESPMLEVTRPSNVLNIEGEFQRELPLVEGKFWSDFLQMTPGVMSRPHNDGSGRQNYFGNAVDHRDAVLDMEGMMAANYNDSNINRTGLSTEAIEDTQVKTGGLDASTPMGYGLAINMISKSGGNQFRGSAGYTFQPFKWNDDNTGGTGTPTTRSINQGDFSLGGPIVQDRAWFFGAARWQSNKTGTGRPDFRINILRALFPDEELQDTSLEAFQPWAKVTTRLGNDHTLSGVYQGDRLHMHTARQDGIRRDEVLSTGGSMYGAKLTSVWGDNVTTTFTASYNNKGGNDRGSYEGRFLGGPSIDIHQNAFPEAGRLEGSGVIARHGEIRSVGCDGCMQFDTASVRMLRGDLTWFIDGGGGSHELQTGFYALPSNRFERVQEYLNDGFILESQRFANPDDPGAGTVPFHRQFIVSELRQQVAAGRDRDIGLYVQDIWKPTGRLTLNLGVRVDFVKRFDAHRNLVRQESTEVGPRAGFSYLVTDDARTVLRGSFARMHEQLQGGRHGVSSFGGSDSAAIRDTYDLDGDGVFETVFDTPAREASVSSQQFDPSMSQPIIDEWIVGYRRQFPSQIAVDVAGIVRTIHNQFSQVDINGFWPDGPFQPFGGWGRVDPNRGRLDRITNNTWSKTHYRALQVTLTKNLSHGFQAMVALHRQWQHLSGTWNPTDPARFIQPDAFPNNRLLHRTRGPSDDDSLPSSNNASMWFPYSIRTNLTWHAPAGVQVSGSYSIVSTSWSGPIHERLPADHPDVLRFGPPRVVSSTGSVQSNPLATRVRFAFPTRGEGQVTLPPPHRFNIKVGKRFSLGGGRDLLLSGTVLNVLNMGRGAEFARGGSNRRWNTAVFLQPGNLQAARAFQFDVLFRF